MTMFEKYSIGPCQIYNPEEFRKIRRGVSIVTFCAYGGGRSPQAAYELDKLGIKAYFFDTGLNGMLDFDDGYRKVLISRLKDFPHRFAFLYPLEVDRHKNLLERLKINETEIFRDPFELLSLLSRRKIRLN